MLANFSVQNQNFEIDKNAVDFEQQAMAAIQAARQNLIESDLAKSYLQWRGLAFEKVEKAGVGFCDSSPQNLPCFLYAFQNLNGDFVGLQWQNFNQNDFEKPPVDVAGRNAEVFTIGADFGFFQGQNFFSKENALKECFFAKGLFNYLPFFVSGFLGAAIIADSRADSSAVAYKVLNAFKGKSIKVGLILCGDIDAGGNGANFENELLTGFKANLHFAGVNVLRETFFHGAPDFLKNLLFKKGVENVGDFYQKSKNDFFERASELKSIAYDAFDLAIDGADFSLFLAKTKAEGTPDFLDFKDKDKQAFLKNELQKDNGVDVENEEPWGLAVGAKSTAQLKRIVKNADKDKSAEEVKKEIESRVLEIDKQLFFSVEKSVDELKKEIADCKAAGVYSTPFAAFNEIYNGGFQQGELFVLAAPPAMGKTAMALQIADFVALNGQKVLYFSLEMPKTALMRRSLCRLSYSGSNYDNGFSTMAIKHGKVDDSRLDSLIAEANSFWKNETILAANFAGFTTTELQIAVDLFLQKTGERPLVIVDYFQILNASKEYLNDKQKADSMIFDLKKIATELGVAMFIVSAVNRASYDKAPTMNSLKESGAIEYTADGVGGLSIADRAKEDSRCFIKPSGGGDKVFNGTKYKELRKKEIQAYYENLSNGGNGLLQFSIEKNREGARGAFELYFNAARSTFYEENPIYEESPLKNSKRQKARRGVDYAAQIGNAAEVDDKSFPF